MAPPLAGASSAAASRPALRAAGRMAVLDNDVVYYRLTGAVPVKP